MALFLSSFTNRIDKKGRTSVPASFRTVLAGQSFSGIIAYHSFVNPCVEACGIDRIERLHDSIDALDPFSPNRDAFATSILGACVQLPFDGEGRVMLPESLIAEAGIDAQAVFVGKGATFEIWNPDRFTAYAAEARELALKERASLRLASRSSTPGNGEGRA